MSLNLEKQLVFYGAYHHNKVNVGIHMLCVPPILLTSFLLLTNTPAVPLPSWLSVPNLPFNVGTAGAVIYSTLYILMEPVAGAMLAPILVGGTAYANHLTSTYGATANSWAGAVNIACWIAQFIGHGKFEGRAPALLDNLVQAIFLAPFFVWFEVLFSLGYRPELKRRIDQAVELEIQKFKKSKEKGANGSAK
ncbi:membrane protein [Pyrenophora tritici-repentis]|uniref:DUF962 containing protein n=3 Tax=Pyrenophora TaxID=5027 RepID=A0A2W1D8M5_9PLEO|nr:hypothetical protein PTT_19732 [Pyrenophora teres f. teres 0-1]KAA8617162.1 membrane protein [Pyrenophora tritici-repentis]KAE8822605.1 hypothetical protein HRS9139_09945 [Pyrenophora teres f. teres]CAA9957733.1 membrane protein [Pyrenophora teres f. maculata]KAE8826264.1 hypothetical protein PTNB85_09209 [Pyrenophora teres f. teres]